MCEKLCEDLFCSDKLTVSVPVSRFYSPHMQLVPWIK